MTDKRHKPLLLLLVATVETLAGQAKKAMALPYPPDVTEQLELTQKVVRLFSVAQLLAEAGILDSTQITEPNFDRALAQLASELGETKPIPVRVTVKSQPAHQNKAWGRPALENQVGGQDSEKWPVIGLR